MACWLLGIIWDLELPKSTVKLSVRRQGSIDGKLFTEHAVLIAVHAICTKLFFHCQGQASIRYMGEALLKWWYYSTSLPKSFLQKFKRILTLFQNGCTKQFQIWEHKPSCVVLYACMPLYVNLYKKKLSAMSLMHLRRQHPADANIPARLFAASSECISIIRNYLTETCQPTNCAWQVNRIVKILKTLRHARLGNCTCPTAMF